MYPDAVECAQLLRLLDTIMVGIDPNKKVRPNGIRGVDEPVPVPTPIRPIVNGKSQKPVRIGRRRLRRNVAKELLAAGNRCAGPHQSQPSVGRPGGGPGNLDRVPVAVKIKVDTTAGRGEAKTRTIRVNDDRRRTESSPIPGAIRVAFQVQYPSAPSPAGGEPGIQPGDSFAGHVFA